MVGCGGGKRAGFSLPPPPVSVTQAIARDVPIYLDEIGKTSADEIVTAQPQVTGKVIGRHFVDGEFIKKGDLLYTIDPRPFQAQLAQAQAQLDQNQAQLEFAQSDFARVASLKGTQAVSQQDYDQKKNAVDVAKAQIAAAQAQIITAQLNLEYCQIKSPIDGRAGQHLVDVGNVVTTSGDGGGTKMLVIEKIDPIYADFTVTESDLSMVQRYMTLAREDKQDLQVMVNLPSSAATQVKQQLSATTEPTTQPTMPMADGRAGKLEFMDNAVQDGTGTVKLRAAVPNADHYFWPGQYVQVRLILTIDKNAVLIPNEAIQTSQTGPFVFIISRNGMADMRNVVLGQKQGDMVVIDSGLKVGETVVTVGQLQLAPGAKVNIVGGGPGPTTQVAEGGDKP
jgi:multidrug efflux system membrane fusion protein